MKRYLTIFAILLSAIGASAQAHSGTLTNMSLSGWYTILSDPAYGTFMPQPLCYWSVAPSPTHCTSAADDLPNGVWAPVYSTDPAGPASSQDTTGLVTGTHYGGVSIRLYDSSASSIFQHSNISCTTTSVCTVTITTPPTFVAGAYVYIAGTVSAALNGQTWKVTGVNTTSPYTYVFTGVGGTLTSQADTGTATISTPWVTMNTEHPTGTGQPVATLPSGCTQTATFPPAFDCSAYQSANFPDFNSAHLTGGDITESCPGGVGSVPQLQADLTGLACGQNIIIPASCTYMVNQIYPLTAVASSSGGVAVYTGTVVTLASTLVGQSLIVTGFGQNAANNGTFVVTAWTPTSLTLDNPSAIAEAHAGPQASAPTLILPNRSCSASPSSYSYIISANWAGLPPSGTRVNNTTDVANMPTIINMGGSATQTTMQPQGVAGSSTSGSTSYWRFVGIQFTINSPTHLGCNGPAQCVTLGISLTEGTTADGYGFSVHDIQFDRTYWYDPPNMDWFHGIYLQGSNIGVRDSYFENFHSNGADGQAFGSVGGTGPYEALNNYAEALGENIFWDGGGFADDNYPHNILVQNNHLVHPLSYIGTANTVKNIYECKSCAQILTDHNTFENEWDAGQYGAMALLPRTGQGGKNASEDDFTFTNNYLKNVDAAFNNGGCDWTVQLPIAGQYTCGSAQRWVVVNNLSTLCDPNTPALACNAGNEQWAWMNAGTQDQYWAHNTTYSAFPLVGTSSFGIYGAVQCLLWSCVAPTYIHNAWLLNNVMYRQWYAPNGAGGGFLGTSSTVNTAVLNDPTTGQASRLTGNLFGLDGDVNGWAGLPGTNWVGCAAPGCTYTGIGNVPDSPSWQFDSNLNLTYPNLAAYEADGLQPGISGAVGERPQPTGGSLTCQTGGYCFPSTF